MLCACSVSVLRVFSKRFATSISTQIDYSVPAHGLHTWTQKSFLSSHIQTGADNFCYSVQFHRVFCSRFFSLSPAVSPAVSQQILLSLAGSLAGSLARHRLACLTRKRLEGRSFLKPLWVSRPNLFYAEKYIPFLLSFFPSS